MLRKECLRKRSTVLGSKRIDKGRLFQIEGPATAKARFCLVEVREDLDRLTGGSESSVHFVWSRRTQQDRLEQGPANNAIPMQPSYIICFGENEYSMLPNEC